MFRRVISPGLLLLGLVTSSAAPPAWWDFRNATNSDPPNPYAAVNQGQLKHFMRKAVDELNGRIPGGAGSELNSLVQQWMIGHPDPDDLHAMTSGQLKWSAQKIHNRLLDIKYHVNLPAWLLVPPDPLGEDKELVNLGQLKTVFAFDLTAPAGQLPLWWQRFYFNGNTGINPGSDQDGGGLSNYQEYLFRTDPNSLTDDNPLLVLDIDNDGLSHVQELAMGTSPTLTDTDGDGVGDLADLYPLDPSRSNSGAPVPGDVLPPRVTLVAPSSALLVSGP